EFYQFFAFFNGIPEKGLDGTRTKNPGPVLKVPTSAQGSKLLRYLDQIPAAEKVVADREAELPKAQEKWEKGLPEVKEPKIGGLVRAFSFDEGSGRPPEADVGGDQEAGTTAKGTATVTNRFVPGRMGLAARFSGST